MVPSRVCTRNGNPWLLSAMILLFFLIALDKFVTDRLDSATIKGFGTRFTARNRNQSTMITSKNVTTYDPRLLTIPEQFLETYIQQHSHASLMRDVQSKDDDDNDNEDGSSSSDRRFFAVAYYWCPERAGNVLNSMFNTIVWAMIHNRTVLWKYHGTVDQHAECQKVLRLADWMPSYDEWRPNPTSPWNLSDPVPVSMNAESWEYDHYTHQVVLYPQIPDVLVGDKSITRNAWSDHPMKTMPYQTYLQALPEPFQSRAADLYRLGKSFLYGMLYTRLFELQRHSDTTIETPTDTVAADTDQDSGASVHYSIGLHSRHTVAADDGSWVPHEIKCLERLLNVFEERFHSSRSCHIYLMSDRPKTVATLTEWSRNKNCSVTTANHHVGGDCIKEHGPWAGAGYLEDLDVVAQATDAMVGDPRRSSTSLLLDVMEYRRYSLGGENSVPVSQNKVEICKLPDKPPSGYNYGPGTPTFRYHPYLEPLAPVRVIRDYSQSKGPPRKGAVWVETNIARVDHVYRALNAFLLAILYDLDLRWTSTSTSSRPDFCDEGVSMIIQMMASNLEGFESLEATNRTVSGILVSTYEGNINFELSDGREYLRHDWSHFPIWKELGDISQTKARAADIFAYGQDVAYGLLFNELISFCPYTSPDPPMNVIPERSVILEVSGETLPADLHRIQSCIGNMTRNEGGSEELLGAEYPRCHIYVLLDQPVFDNTAPSPLISNSGLSSQLSPIMELETDCSLSFSYLPVDPALSLSPRIWDNIRTVAHGRGGWIVPCTVPQNKTLHGLGSSLIRERLEAKRHTEQWKAGRVPFVISPFPECCY